MQCSGLTCAHWMHPVHRDKMGPRESIKLTLLAWTPPPSAHLSLTWIGDISKSLLRPRVLGQSSPSLPHCIRVREADHLGLRPQSSPATTQLLTSLVPRLLLGFESLYCGDLCPTQPHRCLLIIRPVFSQDVGLHGLGCWAFPWFSSHTLTDGKFSTLTSKP